MSVFLSIYPSLSIYRSIYLSTYQSIFSYRSFYICKHLLFICFCFQRPWCSKHNLSPFSFWNTDFFLSLEWKVSKCFLFYLPRPLIPQFHTYTLLWRPLRRPGVPQTIQESHQPISIRNMANIIIIKANKLM